MSKVDVWRVVQTGGLSLLDGGPGERCGYYPELTCILREGHRGYCCETIGQRLDWHRQLLWLRLKVRFRRVPATVAGVRAVVKVLRER
jgi:hypothetical protein